MFFCIQRLLQSKKIKLPACLLNIGGISNLTIVPSFNNHDISSRDVGPGNCLINAWIQAHTKYKFDSGGKISSCGKINEVILEEHPWIEHPTLDDIKSLSTWVKYKIDDL